MAKRILTKICSKCKIKRFADEFSKDKSRDDGLYPQCKVCRKSYRHDHKSEINAKQNQYYKDHKYKNKLYRIKHRTREKQYYKDNKIYILSRIKRYREEHKEQVSAYQKRYNETHKVQKKKYREDHKKEISEYRKTPNGKAVFKRSYYKRRSQKMGAGYEAFNSIEVLIRDGYKCQLCGRKTRPDYKNCNHPLYPTLDHIVPLSKGGEHSKKNTQCLCRQCNIEKNNSRAGDQLRMFG
jgi:5-methylcytosine-specific restriction endonuclease McrA